MAQVIADRRDIDFVLYEQLGIEGLLKHPKFKGLNKKTFDLLINEARNYAVKEILPTLKDGDEIGAVFDNGKVITPESYKKPYEAFVEGGWIAMCEEEEVGGQGFPHVIGQAGLDYLVGASFAFAAYPLAGHGTAKMIEIFGTPEQKKLYMEKVYEGIWTGTMVLTEPEAGSDVGALTTTAVPNGDGTYSIKGNKIFITNGEHDLTDNIIHPVLARIEGEPAGTKGISLFIVPKIWVNEDGSLGEPNDVVCTGIEEKMGLHGSATCQLAFGGKDACKGVLLGEKNKGMRVMFHMMNEARLLVGAIGMCNASAAYLYALDYARQRKQGRDLLDFANADAPSVPIIRHPDVRRMMLWMKSMTEGMRSLVYYGAWLLDKIATAADEAEKEKYNNLLEFLTPIIKSYCTDRGFEVCVQAVQTYGGYGYTEDYPVSQLMRDSKINSIYEGTNGIQAMDLLGRKMGQKKGALFMAFLGEVQGMAAQAKAVPELAAMGESLENVANRVGEVAMKLGMTAMSEKVKTAFSHALPFLDCTGDLCMAWMLLWRAVIAQEKLAKIVGDATGDEKAQKIAKNKNAVFYDGQLKTAQYFVNSILPVTLGRLAACEAVDDSAIDILEDSFGGK